MRPQIVTILTLLLFLANGFSMLGQSTPAKAGPPPPAGQRGPQLPLDTYEFVLFAAGLILGLLYLIYKMRTKRSLQ